MRLHLGRPPETRGTGSDETDVLRLGVNEKASFRMVVEIVGCLPAVFFALDNTE